MTPDSFYSGSRVSGSKAIAERVAGMREEGADILDIGGYSSRPGAEEVSPEEEYSRLASGLEVVRSVWQEAIVSVDTFRARRLRGAVSRSGESVLSMILRRHS